ncbi:hypothetical protein F441_07255 [Phytophthora nicotianae CJ01A1]|uniref:Uncharacterized protein n=4 Tax=Phytophthora nicotianae TaxID=4792 RepID=W2QDX4_PHYN3|nr:hypothetical protein PPTG_22688 [Phytophthora nicotianae INRA-310]ETI48775.1 hypothetical protein F443_07239 [Phytophthora nicotianae P1569]ETK88670.1 hypothetical protein L915_07112 [Phytophthora nicotianae]ETP18550.1 hypothetical protein F441_07255 [Phytophthora nicotianae CJ01A1]ETL95218.1 hypothetical protein L917_06949 [Phytophthora nicotianae]ETN10729.1 hypothetical protein PPTG_22688 [Phytophthora nicotianae INRA-310]
MAISTAEMEHQQQRNGPQPQASPYGFTVCGVTVSVTSFDLFNRQGVRQPVMTTTGSLLHLVLG